MVSLTRQQESASDDMTHNAELELQRLEPVVVEDKYDVIVAGGGAAGVAAAVGAQQSGARTLLIEQYGCLGGAATMRNVLTYCGLYTAEDQPRQAVGGVVDLFLKKLIALGGASKPLKKRGVFLAVDSEAVKLALDSVAADAGFDLLFHTTLIGASREGERIDRIQVFDHRGRRSLSAKAFVDASGEADLAFLAGSSTRYGNDREINIATLAIRLGGILPEADLAPSVVAEAIRREKKRGNQKLDQEQGLVVRLPVSGDALALLVDEEYDARDGSSITRAEMRARSKAWEYLKAIRGIPGCEKAFITSTGPTLGTRESRHLNALYQLTRADVEKGREFEDVIALGAWAMEYHPRIGEESTWFPIRNNCTFDIPLRCLQSVDTPNLLAAGRTVDGDKYAGASVRVMGTAFATGHAAGVAAAQFAAYGKIDAKSVQAALTEQNALLRL